MNNYHYPVQVFWSNIDECYIAVAPDLDRCSACGDSYLEAMQELNIAMELWIETAQKIGRELPTPSQFYQVA